MQAQMIQSVLVGLAFQALIAALHPCVLLKHTYPNNPSNFLSDPKTHFPSNTMCTGVRQIPFCNHGNAIQLDEVCICQCEANTFWNGSDCNTCGLQCVHGAPNEECTRCICSEPQTNLGWSYTGLHCDCPQITLSLALKYQPSFETLNSSNGSWLDNPQVRT